MQLAMPGSERPLVITSHGDLANSGRFAVAWPSSGWVMLSRDLLKPKNRTTTRSISEMCTKTRRLPNECSTAGALLRFVQVMIERDW